MTILLFIVGFALFIVGMFIAISGEAPSVIIGSIVAIVGLCLILYTTVLASEESKDACEGIGGEYLIVNREYNVALKQIVNVYGCVK